MVQDRRRIGERCERIRSQRRARYWPRGIGYDERPRIDLKPRRRECVRPLGLQWGEVIVGVTVLSLFADLLHHVALDRDQLRVVVRVVEVQRCEIPTHPLAPLTGIVRVWLRRSEGDVVVVE